MERKSARRCWKRPWRRQVSYERPVVLAGAAILLLPLFCVEFIPAVDLPQHVAVARVLSDLLQGEPTEYTWNLQPMGYLGAYLSLVPMMWAFGGVLGPVLCAKLTLVGLCIGFLAGLWFLTRELEGPQWSVLLGSFWLYNISFAWGFLSSFVSMVAVVWALRFVIRAARTDRPVDVAAAVVLTLSTGIFHVAMAAFALAAMVIACWVFRASFRASVAVGLAAALPMVPALGSVVLGENSAKPEIRYEPAALVDHADNMLRSYGPDLPHFALIAALVFSIVGVGCSLFSGLGRQQTERVRFALLLAILGAIFFVLVPTHITAGGSPAWALNSRYLPFFALGLALAVSPPKGPLRHVLFGHSAAVLVLYVFGIMPYWLRFDREMRPLVPVLEALPEHAKVATFNRQRRTYRSWLPVFTHAPVYAVAVRGGASNQLFTGAHLPLRLEQGLRTQLDATGRLELGRCEYFLSDRELVPNVAPKLDGLELVVESGRFALYRRSGQNRRAGMLVHFVKGARI